MHPPLFCKPADGPAGRRCLYATDYPEILGVLSFRSLDLEIDLDMLYDWVNRQYTRRFWGLRGSKPLLEDTYRTVLESPHAHSFIGRLDGAPVCQVDIYQVGTDELAKHVDPGPHDCGLHFLMRPPSGYQKGLSQALLQAFISYYFSFPAAERLYCEPDEDNALANLLAKKVGFEFQRTIELSYKVANLYLLTKAHHQS